MRWTNSEKDSDQTRQNAYRIYQDILLSIETYSDDSFEAKFFLPEEISNHCKAVAASFALVLYSPTLEMKEIYGSRLYYLYYLSLIYGAHIYLKEHALHNDHHPYLIEKDDAKIEEIKNMVTEKLGDGFTLTDEAAVVIELYKQQLSHTKKKVYLEVDGKTFAEADFDRCLHGTLLWGYFFAKEMIYTM